MRFIIFLIFTILLSTCSSSRETMKSTAYSDSIKSWQTKRAKSLTAPTGWLSLVGLFWLKEGTSTFGSSPKNKLIFPKNTPEVIGTFNLTEEAVTMEVEDDVPVKIGEETSKKIMLQADITGQPTYANLGSVNWHLIKRADRYGIRVRDGKNEAIQNFKGIPYFSIQEQWKIPATLRISDGEKSVMLRNVVDMDVEMKLEGYLVFEIDGKTYELEAMAGGDDEYFIIFADETTGENTYGAGRYIYVSKVDAAILALK